MLPPPETAPPLSPEAARRADQILYLALLSSHGVYAGLTIFLGSSLQSGTPSHPSLALPLVATALVAAGIALFLDATRFRDAQIERWIDAAKQLSSDRQVLAREARQRALSTSILRWAVADIPSLIGLLIVLLAGQPQTQGLMLVALGALCHLSCRPKMGATIARIDEKLQPPRAP